jgi:hypothetical protein
MLPVGRTCSGAVSFSSLTFSAKMSRENGWNSGALVATGASSPAVAAAAAAPSLFLSNMPIS